MLKSMRTILALRHFCDVRFGSEADISKAHRLALPMASTCLQFCPTEGAVTDGVGRRATIMDHQAVLVGGVRVLDYVIWTITRIRVSWACHFNVSCHVATAVLCHWSLLPGLPQSVAGGFHC